MNTFIQEVAVSLHSRYGSDISDVNMLFPTSRASLFFSDALSRKASTPVWAPRSWSVSEIASRMTGLEIVERPRLVAELFRAYSSVQPEVQFDSFYQWGCQLLADFDIIDQYLVDTSMLFANMDQLAELNVNLDQYMSKEQIEVVRRFWGTLRQGPESDLKRNFCSTWRRVAEAYDIFRSRLREKRMAYVGMAYREAVGLIEGGMDADLPDRWAVVGFNALSLCERKILQYLKDRRETSFFWDYDEYYFRDKSQEAGDSLRDSLERFGEAPGISHDLFRAEKRIDVVSCGSTVLQCQHAVSVLRRLAAEEGVSLDKRTAVVLCDETLLLPLLHALPEELGRPNVTMGYPLRSTLAYSLMDRLLSLYLSVRKDGTYAFADVDGVLRHPYVSGICQPDADALLRNMIRQRMYSVPASMFAGHDILGRIFAPSDDDGLALLDRISGILSAIAEVPYDGVDARFRVEFLTVLADCIARHRNVLEKCDISISRRIGATMLRRATADVHVPFVGEPLEGFQIMGMLETRCLDFDNVIILSASDDTFPGKRTADSSFIPCSLRKGYSLPTVEDQEAVYAYNFYCLLQRAKDVTVMYSSHTDESDSGEPSRYVRQIEMESGKTVMHSTVGSRIYIDPESVPCVAKNDEVMERLHRYTRPDGKTMSPSKLFSYADCPMKFYYMAVADVRAEDTLEDDMEANTFGSITHAALENLYRPLKGRLCTKEMVESLAPGVDEAISQAVDKEYFREADRRHTLTPSLRIIVSAIRRYIVDRVIPYDAAHADFLLHDVEMEVNGQFRFREGGCESTLFLYGVADRVDCRDSVYRVVDYKTGKSDTGIKSIDSLFDDENSSHRQNYLNTLLYAMMVSEKLGQNVVPALYYMGNMGDGYEALICDKSSGEACIPFPENRARFAQRLGEMLEQIFDPSRPFTACGDAQKCRCCDYAAICGREQND